VKARPPGIICFHCGRVVDESPVLLEEEHGEVCPVCRDRLLESLPPIFPHYGAPAAAVPEDLAEDLYGLLDDEDEPA